MHALRELAHVTTDGLERLGYILKAMEFEARADEAEGLLPPAHMLDGKPGGVAVTIAARVLASARGRDVIVTQTVKDLVAGSGFRFDDHGEHELKGVPERWHLYAVAATTERSASRA